MWMSFIPQKSDFVCSDHFQAGDYEIYNTKRVLRKDAVPKISSLLQKTVSDEFFPMKK